MSQAPASSYEAALAWLQLAERRDPLNEAELAAIWGGQRFPAEALQAPAAARLRVVNPGRLNSGAGPDFLDAVLELDGCLRRGDVELHVRASAFRQHGHHLDPAYDGLALHVVYLADEGGETLLSSGASVPVAAFAPWLQQRSAELARWLAAPDLWREPCRDAAARLGEAALDDVLLAAGRQRFEGRCAALAAAIERHGAQESLWRALLDNLGVGSDRDGLRRLGAAFGPALAARVVAGRTAEGAYAALLGALLAVAGLAPAPPGLACLLPPPLAVRLHSSGRPANRPERRLAALAALNLRAGLDLTGFAASSVRQAADANELVQAWCVAAKEGPALLGRERAQELVLNAVLPFVVAAQPGLAGKVEALLGQLRPAAPYGKTAFLESNLLRTNGKRRVTGAISQQGLLWLLDQWCRQGGCGRCPLS